MKHTLFIALLSLLMVGSAWAKPPLIANSTANSFTVEITFPAGDTSDTDLIPRGGYCTVSVIIAGSDVVELYQVPLSTTAASAGTIVGSAFSATTTSVTTVQPSQLGFKARATTAAAGGSKMIIKCSNTQLTEGLNLNQALPPKGEYHNLKATITSPASFHLGTGVTLAAIGENEEADHVIGWYYNKNGPGGASQNKFEHAFHHRVETNFKNDDATGSNPPDNQVEFNQDVAPPDNSCELTGFNDESAFETKAGIGGVREPITWSGGGTSEIVAYNSTTNVMEFRMNNSISVGVSETVTITDGGETASCNGEAFIYLGSTAAHTFRPYIQTWAVLAGTSIFSWKTSASAPNSVFRIANQGSAVNSPSGNSVGPGFQSYTPIDTWGSPAIVATATSNGSDGDGETAKQTPVGIRIDMDYRGTDWDFENSAALLINTPTGPLGANSTIQTPYAIKIQDQQAFDTSSSAPVVRIDTQTCGGSACTNGNAGNWTMQGGEYNNGHIVLGGIGSTGTHLWRDTTINQLKIRSDRAPFSASDGEPFVTGSGVTTHGPSIWSVSDASGSALFDTGTKVCGYTGTVTLPGVGMDCHSVIRFGSSGSESLSLSTNCLTSITNGDTFIAMCY